jgi:hypothetical protein
MVSDLRTRGSTAKSNSRVTNAASNLKAAAAGAQVVKKSGERITPEARSAPLGRAESASFGACGPSSSAPLD